MYIQIELLKGDRRKDSLFGLRFHFTPTLG